MIAIVYTQKLMREVCTSRNVSLTAENCGYRVCLRDHVCFLSDDMLHFASVTLDDAHAECVLTSDVSSYESCTQCQLKLS